jgi:murein DD-endopeptidase MepM/ murein hydrolase activator NlpD
MLARYREGGPSRATPARFCHIRRTVLLSVAALIVALSLVTERMIRVSRALEAPRVERPTLKGDLRSEVVNMDRHLHSLLEFLEEGRTLEDEARLLAGLPLQNVESPVAGTGEGFPEVVCLTDRALAREMLRAGVHAEVALTDVSALAGSYRDILAGMEAQSEAWESIPTILPLDCARLTSNYGSRRDPIHGGRSNHHGLDLAANYGAPVRASASGTVAKAAWIRGYGRFVEVDHGNGIVTRYAHNSRLVVEAGERVRRGQVIARLGGTGRASAPHLHYEVLVNGRQVNPSEQVVSGSLTE